MWGKKLNAWEVREGEPIQWTDVALGLVIGVAATLLCVGVLSI